MASISGAAAEIQFSSVEVKAGTVANIIVVKIVLVFIKSVDTIGLENNFPTTV